MRRPFVSQASSALRRALIGRAGLDADRILLTDWFSVDWRSLTFEGERHRAAFVFRGDGAADAARTWLQGIEDAEFDLGPSTFVAEIAVVGPPHDRDDGAVQVEIEALTLKS